MEDQASKACRRQPRDEVVQELKKMYLASIELNDYKRALNFPYPRKVPLSLLKTTPHTQYALWAR